MFYILTSSRAKLSYRKILRVLSSRRSAPQDRLYFVPRNDEKSAFTLAEVLITLLIIGVVASIVVPNLINDSQEAEFKASWKKAYAEASQAYTIAIVNNGENFDSSGCYSGTYAKFYSLKENLQVIKTCYTNTFGNCWASEGVSPAKPGCPSFDTPNQNYNYSFVTSDGKFWMLYGNADGYHCKNMAVDVNGMKGPNQWGKDVLQFSMNSTNISPGGCGETTSSKNYLYQ